MIVLPWLKDGSECGFIFRILAKSITKLLIFIIQNWQNRSIVKTILAMIQFLIYCEIMYVVHYKNHFVLEINILQAVHWLSTKVPQNFKLWSYPVSLTKTKVVDEWKTNMMSLAILFHLLCAQHVSDINISIFRSLRLCWWITTSVVLFRTRPFIVYWTVHLCNSWGMKDQLDVTCYFISLTMCSTCFGH